MASITQREVNRTARNAAGMVGHDRPPLKVSGYCRWKHVPDRICAVLLLIPATPMVFLLVMLVRLTSRGPGIYQQIRVGRNGRTFTMYKIRTMRQDAEVRTGPTWATNNDPRVTRVGQFIRSLHLDELPQLLNVIKGDMDLVGPRPERPEFTHLLSQEIDGYGDRLLVRPGITGLAQLNLPPDSDLNSVRRKLVLDLDYVRSASFGLDFRILCWTAFRLLGLRNRSMQVLRLQRTVTLPCDMTASATSTRDSEAACSAHCNAVALSRNGNGHLPKGEQPLHAPAQVKPR